MNKGPLSVVSQTCPEGAGKSPLTRSRRKPRDASLH